MREAICLLSLTLLLGCNDKGSTDTNPADDTSTDTTPIDTSLAPATVPLSGECAMEDDYGGFVVEAYEDYSIISGTVADSVVPVTILEDIGAEGDCRMLRRNNPFCDPACAAGETCDFDGSCITYPANQDLGEVSVVGLGKSVVMEGVVPGYTYFNTSLPHPAFASGDLIELQMPSGTYGPVTLHGVGVDQLSVTAETWEVEESQDLAVEWAAPSGDVVRSEIILQINIDQHGTSPSTIYCTFEDDGQGTVPASLIDQLVNQGVSGFPNGSLTRRTADSTAIGDGCMDFLISSPREVSVNVVGYTPCISDLDCPDGQTCNLDLQICQ